MIISYIVPFTRLVNKLVSEKETKVKESMKMMGMVDSAFWMSYLITYFTIFTILAFLITAIGSTTVFEYSNKIIVFLFF